MLLLDNITLFGISYPMHIGGRLWHVEGFERLFVRDRNGELTEATIEIDHKKCTALVATGDGVRETRRRLARIIRAARRSLKTRGNVSIATHFPHNLLQPPFGL